MHECEDTYAQINKILMDYEQLMKSKGLAKLLCDWRGLSRKGKIDELMCMEGSHLYSSREDGKKLTNWVVKRVAEMTSDFEQGLQEKEAPYRDGTGEATNENQTPRYHINRAPYLFGAYKHFLAFHRSLRHLALYWLTSRVIKLQLGQTL